MLKLPMLVTLFICFVYSNNEHNNDTQLAVSELQLETKQDEENKSTIQTIKGHYIEEKKSSKPCKERKNRRLGDKDNKDPDLFESLPLTATLEQMNTASIGNKIVTSSIHGAKYNYKNENTDRETENSDLNSISCDCDDCVLETNKKVLQFESLALDNNNNPFNIAAIHSKTSEPDLVDSNSNSFNNADEPDDRNNNSFNNADEPDDRNNNSFNNADEPDDRNNNSFNNADEPDDRNNNPLASVPLNINTDERKKPCNKGLNMNTRRRKCGRIDLSKNSSITPITRRILPGIIENPSNQELEDNKLYQDSPQFNHNDETKTENRQNYFPNVPKVSNSYDINLVHNMNINEARQPNKPSEDSVESQLTEPTRGKGIYDLKDAGVMLLENSRVCYACSTLSDPTCWTPNRSTTVKYCRKGHKSCLTKSFKHKGKSVIIRDCGSHCVNMPSEENYSSCSICHSDLCNSASSMSIYVPGIAIIAFVGLLFNTY